MQNILNRIYQELDTFSTEQQKIARVILENPTKVSEMNLEEFAELLQVDQNNITKFCEKLGFSNFIQLREALGNKALLEKNTTSKVFYSLPKFEKENMLNILNKTNCIQVVGAEESLLEQIIELFNVNGIFTIGFANQKISLAQTLHLTANDTLLVIEPEKISDFLIKQTQIAKHQGSSVVTLGKNLSRRVGMEADCFIDCDRDDILETLRAWIETAKKSNLKLQKFVEKYNTIAKIKLS